MAVCIELVNNNYGSMLQSFATQQMLRDFGMDYDLLTYKKVYTPWFILKSMPRVFNRILQNDKRLIRAKRNFLKKHPVVNESLRKRTRAFNEFRKVYFTAPRKRFEGYKNLKNGAKAYDAFLTGSDQLWSPAGLPTNFFNLRFAPDEGVKISYASSFGVSKIPWYQTGRTRAFLNRIQHVSCRENSGKAIVKELTGRDVPVVCDPTLMYSGEEWVSLLSTKRPYEEKYIFSYLLGPDPATREEVKKLSAATGMKIVSIHQFLDADLNFGDISVEDAGPAEFVSLIRHAEYVCTDSFHGSVFSILMHKKFVVFNRYLATDKSSKNTRIDSLCENLGLTERRYSGDVVADVIADIDYSAVEEKLVVMRARSYQYLENAFDSIKEK